MTTKKHVPCIILSILAALALVVLTGFHIAEHWGAGLIPPPDVAEEGYYGCGELRGWPLVWLGVESSTHWWYEDDEIQEEPTVTSIHINWPNFTIDFAFWLVPASAVVFLVRKIGRKFSRF